MDDYARNATRRQKHEAMIRGVVDCAREVRLSLYDSRVIFGTLYGASPGAGRSFRIRPWGVSEGTMLRFEDVSVAAPVKQMGWQRHCAIAAAQRVGVFLDVGKGHQSTELSADARPSPVKGGRGRF